MDWKQHNGGPCPCVGYYVEVCYSDGGVEQGIAEDHVYWRYVVRWRIVGAM